LKRALLAALLLPALLPTRVVFVLPTLAVAERAVALCFLGNLLANPPSPTCRFRSMARDRQARAGLQRALLCASILLLPASGTQAVACHRTRWVIFLSLSLSALQLTV
jgi:hypothetical protein